MVNNPKRKRLFANTQLVMLCVILAMVMAILLGIALLMNAKSNWQNGDPKTQITASADTIGGQAQNDWIAVPVTQQGEKMVVTTAYGQLSYPSAFIDVIQVCSTNYESSATLAFEGNINGRIVPLYFLWFNGESGQEVGSILNVEGQTVTVSVEFFSLPDDLTGSEKDTLLAAQETVNDVLASLKENENYMGK